MAREYDGAIYLYFDDTNPEKCRQEYVDAIKADLEWMGVNFGKEYYASDFIDTVYDSGRRLLRQGDAYVCMCSESEVEKNRELKANCSHRKHTPQENLSLFEEMVGGKYDEGQAIVRLDRRHEGRQCDVQGPDAVQDKEGRALPAWEQVRGVADVPHQHPRDRQSQRSDRRGAGQGVRGLGRGAQEDNPGARAHRPQDALRGQAQHRGREAPPRGSFAS